MSQITVLSVWLLLLCVLTFLMQIDSQASKIPAVFCSSATPELKHSIPLCHQGCSAVPKTQSQSGPCGHVPPLSQTWPQEFIFQLPLEY